MKIRFLQNIKRPAAGTTLKTRITQPNVVRCENYQLFRQGETADVPQQYVPGLAGREDVEFLDRDQ
jgi:hypothetical protein